VTQTFLKLLKIVLDLDSHVY